MSKGRNALVTVEKVAPDSLPRSLRHYSKNNCLKEANELLLLLNEICWGARDSDSIFNGWGGMLLVLDLIQDKVAIGSGEYHFPLSGSSDDPVLVEREEE